MTIFSGCLSLLFSPSVFLFGYQYWRSGYMQAHVIDSKAIKLIAKLTPNTTAKALPSGAGTL